MRNIQTILLAVVLCVFCSCSDRGEDISSRRYPILFGSTDTRAVADITDLQNNGFKVYAHFEGSLGSASFEKDVTYNSEKDVWGYEGIQYWIPSTKYWFTAFYPTTSSAGTVKVTEQESNYHSYTITNFDITKQEDIMVAQAYREVGANASAPESGNVVDLNFQHLLACVVVEIKCEVANCTIDEVILSGIYDNATCENGVWSSSNTTRISHVPQDITLDSTNYVDVTNGGLLVIPQTIDGSQTITINTSIKKYPEVTIPILTWEKGKKYTYRAIIKQNDIVFNDAPEVAVWDSDSATGSVIIK